MREYFNATRLAEVAREPRWPLTEKQIQELNWYWDQYALNTCGGLIDLLEHASAHTDLASVAEVGSFRGVSSECIAMYAGKLLCVDPWADDATIYEDWCARMRRYGNVNAMRLTSKVAAEGLAHAGLSFDLVYLDGMHTYDFVCEDIQLWLPLIKPGGWLAGHDYVDYQDSWAAQWIQVKQAVVDTLGPVELTVFKDSSWLYRKPE